VLVGAAIIFVLGYRGIQVSARTGTVLGLFEIGVFVVLALFLIFEGDHNTLAVFTTKYANNPDFTGFSGVVAASVFTILAFIGFEAAAPLSEEAKDPTRTIGKAVILSCLLIGLFYVLTTYAAGAFTGPAQMKGFATGTGWEGLARDVWGAGWVLIFLAIVNSTIANSNAGSNAATRTMFAMGRVRILPHVLSDVHPTFRSPHIAVYVQAVIGVGVALGLGFAFDPITAFGLVATIAVVLFIPIYIVVNLSSLLYYARKRPHEFNWLLHGVVPVVGILFFIPAEFAASGVPIFKFIPRLSSPLSYAGLVAGIWMLVGVAYLIYLYNAKPQRVADTGKVFLEEGAPETVGAV
jgi:amino acid transporter